MVTASSELNVEHSIDSRLEQFKLCGMTTVFDVVGHSYRLHQATRFDCIYKRTGAMTLCAVCNQEYNLFCEVVLFGSYINIVCNHRRMFQDNRRDIGAVTVETARNISVSDNISMEKYLWHGDSGVSCHEASYTDGIFDYSRIHSYLKIGNGEYLCSSRIGKKKVMIVQANSSTLDFILCDGIYVPDMCIKLKDYKGSTSDVLVTWETGESTYEPLDLIASEPGWKCFRHYTRKKNKLGCIVNQNKVSSYRREPFWKIGVLVLRTHKQAMELDMKHIDKKWQDADGPR
jgi:hypothetical protein